MLISFFLAEKSQEYFLACKAVHDSFRDLNEGCFGMFKLKNFNKLETLKLNVREAIKKFKLQYSKLDQKEVKQPLPVSPSTRKKEEGERSFESPLSSSHSPLSPLSPETPISLKKEVTNDKNSEKNAEENISPQIPQNKALLQVQDEGVPQKRMTQSDGTYKMTPVSRERLERRFSEEVGINKFFCPFQVSAHQAVELFDKWRKSLWFAPAEFVHAKNFVGQQVSACLLPYFLFSATTQSIHRGKIGFKKRKEGKFEIEWQEKSCFAEQNYQNVKFQAYESSEAPCAEHFLDEVGNWSLGFEKFLRETFFFYDTSLTPPFFC